MATSMRLEACAEMRAEMEAGTLRDEVLIRAGLSVEEWTTAQTEWLGKMGAEIERGRFELTNRYSQAFIERQRALQANTPTAIEAPAEPAPPIVQVPVAQASIVVAAEVPSFLLPGSPPLLEPIAAPSLAPATAGASSELGETSLDIIFPKGAELPFLRSPVASPQRALPLPAPAAPTRPAANHEPADWFETSMEVIFPKGVALPFANAPAPPVAALDATMPLMPNPSLEGTSLSLSFPLASALPFAPTLPFAASAAPKPLPPAPPVPPPPLAAPAPPRAPEESLMDMTSLSVSFPVVRVLPFGASPGPLPPPAPAPTYVAPIAVQVPTAPAGGPVSVGGYTLEQHVSLCAEITFNPARVAETLARYRITAEGKVELDRLWKERFAVDPALDARWREAHRMYLTFLGTRRP